MDQGENHQKFFLISTGASLFYGRRFALHTESVYSFVRFILKKAQEGCKIPLFSAVMEIYVEIDPFRLLFSLAMYILVSPQAQPMLYLLTLATYGVGIYISGMYLLSSFNFSILFYCSSRKDAI